jgi:hypothetical protein
VNAVTDTCPGTADVTELDLEENQHPVPGLPELIRQVIALLEDIQRTLAAIAAR